MEQQHRQGGRAPATGMFPIGAATEAAGNGTANIKVRLDGIATVAA